MTPESQTQDAILSLVSRIESTIHDDVTLAQTLLLDLLTTDFSKLSERILSNIYRVASTVEFSSGNTATAKNYALLSLQFANDSKDRKAIVSAENSLGRCLYLEGYYTEALKHFQSSLNSAREFEDSDTLATTLNNIAACYMNLGLWSNSLECHLEALTIRRNSGDKINTAQSLTNIGLVYYHLTEYQKCYEYQNDAEKICIELGNIELQAVTIANKALSLIKMKKYELGLAELERSIELHTNTADKARLAIAILNKGATLFELNQYDDARHIVKKAIILGEEVGDIHTISVGYHTLGKIELSLNNHQKAERLLVKSLELSRRLNLILEEKSTHQILAELYSKMGEWQKAYEHLNTYYVIEQTRTKEEADAKFNHFKVLHEIEKIKTEAIIEQERNSKLTQLLNERNNALVQLEQQNKQLEELHKEKDEFIGIASHDLKNPLVGLRSYCKMLLTDFEVLTKDELRDSLQTIYSTADKTFAIVGKLLDINKIESGEIDILLSEVDVSHLVKSLTRIYSENASAKDIQFSTEFSKTEVYAHVDETLIVQILDNLISNALKFSPPKTTVTIRVIS